MDFNNNKMSPDAQLIQHGLAIANRKLLELDAALGRSLILGRQDGTFEEKAASEFLHDAKLSDWWKEHFADEAETPNDTPKS